MDSQSEIVYGDIRLEEDNSSGFIFITLRDADDGDVIVLSEDAIVSLHARLGPVVSRILRGEK